MGFLAGLELNLRSDFLGVGQRRGVHVSPPKIGSRDGEIVFGGIWGRHADLRRDFVWGNLNLGFFGLLGGCPRGATEEGDQLVLLLCILGEF
jgi:hypothetical protein